ncbi:hypothetical protein [Sphingobacterium detergens]|uniref:Uncharacterized protein n=1 Tax=Sphingobacterium detergens TaxID=1145106 RepID=A0A420ALN9_SPHD1|nr:hypothetical protein [Sphingobacterium detergens]RKE45358.1 hypothetical protein DFQ12_4430 [Sphingobacterium detergens]
MTDYQSNKLELFSKHISSILKKKIKDRSALKKKSEEISNLLSESSPKLDGRIFHKVLIILGEDIDAFCNNYFGKHEGHILASLEKNGNLFHDLINPYINSQNQLSDSSKIIAKRFNRLFSGELKELYADEIYGLSKALACKASELFDYFYGDGPRPMIGITASE